MPLSWDEFRRVEMRVGEIVDVQDFPEARDDVALVVVDVHVHVLRGGFDTTRIEDLRPRPIGGEQLVKPVVAIEAGKDLRQGVGSRGHAAVHARVVHRARVKVAP